MGYRVAFTRLHSLPVYFVTAALMLTACTSAPEPAVSSPAPETAPEARPLLITTQGLQDRLGDPNLRIIDVRPLRQFRRGHVPGAVNLQYTDLLDPDSDIQGQRLPDQHLGIKLSARGIGADTEVVIYDDSGGHLAARLLWVLQYFGHDQVRVLDGGFPTWQADGAPVIERVDQVERQKFSIDLEADYLATSEYVLEHLNDPNTIILDVRPAKMFAAGHIPGATNLPWIANITAEKTWKEPEELRSWFEEAGVTPDKNIVVYCQFGNMNHHTYVTLKSLGYENVRSYDLAWVGWTHDPSRPTAPAAAS